MVSERRARATGRAVRGALRADSTPHHERTAMPPEVKLENPESFLAAISDKSVCHPSIGPELPGVSFASSQSIAGDVLSVNLHGKLGLSAFNSKDDKDEDGVFGELTNDLPADALRPQLQLPASGAYLKYRASAGLKAAAQGQTLGSLGFALEGGFDAILADYHLHTCPEKTRDAVGADLLNLRTSLRLKDVLALAPGEAVTQQVVGRLSAAVEVSWSDVFTGQVGALARLAGPNTSVLFKVNAGASVKASVSLRDEFLLAFSRVDAERWRVGLHKARTRDAALGLDLGVSVAFADPAQVEGILNAASEGVIGQPLSRVDALLKKASLENLSAEERELADFLLDRLGLTRVTATIETIRTRIAGIREKIRETIEAVATAKIALGFVYEYRRMRQDTTVGQCLVPKAAVERHHAALVRGRFEELFADAASQIGGAKLEHFLYQKTIKSEASWGFSLSIGKWVTIGGKDTKTLLNVDRLSASGKIQRSFVGTRAYREAGDARDRWGGDLSASMPGFSRDTDPAVSEFETSVSLSRFDEQARLDKERLSAWLDLAVLWDVVSEADVARVHASLKDAGAIGKKCSVVAQVAVPHTAFAIMRMRIAAANASEFGAFLGAAMPWSEEPGRQTVAARRRLYGPLWERFLADSENVHRDGRQFVPMARKHLIDQGFRNLADMEQLYLLTPLRPHDANVFAGTIDLNPHTFQNCRDFFIGVKALNAGVLSGKPDQGTFQHVFDDMQSLWRQGHHVLAAGAYLVEIARVTAVLKDVVRSMSITIGAGGNNEQIVAITR
jgi:hypothetical protein